MRSPNLLGSLRLPENGLGIVRARTILGSMRMWDLPFDEAAVNQVVEEICSEAAPGLYVLVEESGHRECVYVGQSENLRKRLLDHMSGSQHSRSRCSRWSRVLVFSDGRCASQSDLNEEVRLSIEDYLCEVFRVNDYDVSTKSTRQPRYGAYYDLIIEKIKQEIDSLLLYSGRIRRLTGKVEERVVDSKLLKEIIENKGYRIIKWGKYYGKIEKDNQTLDVVIREGSFKNGEWQVTLRDDSKQIIESGRGFLLVPRGGILFAPSSFIKSILDSSSSSVFKNNTLDLFIRFQEQSACIRYKSYESDASPHLLMPRTVPRKSSRPPSRDVEVETPAGRWIWTHDTKQQRQRFKLALRHRCKNIGGRRRRSKIKRK
ncbi:MAG: GIY-YIG nuclease family protein [Thermoflexales bacterium]|nr:GIY-YIG nuclease family protein [Thermoflexales bacterium]